MTLTTIVANALAEVGEFESPSTVINNSNTTVRRMKALSEREGYLLARRGRWQQLLQTHTFDTVASDEDYDLPSGFNRFVGGTWWDRTNFWKLFGPATPAQWQELKSGIVTEGVRRWFRVQGNKFYLHPVPPASGETIAYEFISKNWVDTNGDGVGDAEAWTADTDTAVLDEGLMTMGCIWRFLKSNGLPYQEEFNAYEREVSKQLPNWGAPTLCLDNQPLRSSSGIVNIPEGGFGA